MIYIQDLVTKKYDYLDSHNFCNYVYNVYVSIDEKVWKITNFRIAVQCINETDEKTGIYILTSVNNTKIQHNTILPINKLKLIDENEKTLTISIKELTLDDLIRYGAYLIKMSNQTYGNINPEENKFAIEITTMDQLQKSLLADKTYSLIAQTGILNPAPIIEHQLDLLGLVDGVNDKSDNLLNAFNNDNLFSVKTPRIKINGQVDLGESKINSMDCFISNLSEKERDDKNRIRLKYGIIRSIIDFFHDYVRLAVELQNNLYKFILENYVRTRLIDESILNTLNNIGSTVTTSGGNVSQTACKNLWSTYAISYRQELSISFFPISEFGNLGSANIFTDISARNEFTPEFIQICKDFKNNFKIEYFYIEAQNTPLSSAFVKSGFGMITSNMAVRDAAPGYSIKTAIVKDGLAAGNAIIIDRIYSDTYESYCPNLNIAKTPSSEYGYRVTVGNGPNCLVSKFLGFSDIAVIANNTTNTILSKTKDENKTTIVVDNKGAKIMELGLNALIATANRYGFKFPQLRGSGNASPISQVNVSDPFIPVNAIIPILSLKTYTDYCQAVEIEDLKTANIRVVAASSDYLAARTFSDFFATPTVYVGVNHIIATCSDTRYSSLTVKQLTSKLNVFNKLIIYKQVFQKYITQKLGSIAGYISSSQNKTLSPSIYYGCATLLLSLQQTLSDANQILEDITSDEKVYYFNTLVPNEQINFIKQFPVEVSLYIAGLCKINLFSQIFKESHDNFSDIILKIISISNRITINEFLNVFYGVEQALTNALVTTIDPNEFTINLIALYTVAIATKNKYAKDSFITNLNSQIKELIKANQSNQNDRIIQIFTIMTTTIEYIFELNNNILSQLPKTIKMNFIAAVPNVFGYDIQPPVSEYDIYRIREFAEVVPELNPIIDGIDNTNVRIEESADSDTIEELSRREENMINLIQKEFPSVLKSKQTKEEQEQAALERVQINTTTSQLEINDSNVNLAVPYSEVLQIITQIYNNQSINLEEKAKDILNKMASTLTTFGGKKRNKTIKHKYYKTINKRNKNKKKTRVVKDKRVKNKKKQ